MIRVLPNHAITGADGAPITQMDVLWITAGLGCDGDTIAITAATQPSIEDLVLGALPWIPKVKLHNPFLAFDNGDEFLQAFPPSSRRLTFDTSFWWSKARSRTRKIKTKDIGPPSAPTQRPASRLPRVTGSIARASEHGPWWPPEPAPPMAASTPWKAIRPAVWVLPDYLGWDWKSNGGIPIVCVPGCPVQPDNFMETLLYLLYMAAGRAPMIPLDEALRPTWLFGNTVHEGCDRGGFYEQAQFAEEYGSPLCIVKLGCWGPVVQCNVGKRGWMGGIGGCPNVGGICIGCTMPGFPDKFMPFMNQPPGSFACLQRRSLRMAARFMHCAASLRHH